MDGLYFYKLVSPYKEDVTKDCKLTVNEIDHNFVTLKDADIKNISFDNSTYTITLTRNNCDKLTCSLADVLSGITNDLQVDYDSVAGVITITHNNQKITIDKLITQDNINFDVMTKVITDGTLDGLGTKNSPLGINELEKTGQFLPAFEMIDLVEGEFMPKHVRFGDRVVTRESISDFGYIYNYKSVQLINSELTGGWRIPTKADWDNMLNAIEPCDKYRNHGSATANRVLGKYAGKLLKSSHFWLEDECDIDDCDCISRDANGVPTSLEGHVNGTGVDEYGMGMMPSGYHDSYEVVEYFLKRGYYWTNTQISETDVYIKRFDYDKSGVVQNVESPRSYFSIRLVKDYDGNNYTPVTIINGEPYETALMPALNTEHGHSIWTTKNLALTEDRYKPLCPNNCEGVSSEIVYYVNEWNGTDWNKKRMYEGDSIVLLRGLSGETSEEYRIIKGELVSVTASMQKEITDVIEAEIEDIKETIGSGFTDDSGNTISITDKINGIDDEIDEIEDALSAETEERKATEEEIKESIETESDLRKEGDEILSGAIEDLSAVLESEIERVDERIDEANDAISGLTELTEELSAITEVLTEKVDELSGTTQDIQDQLDKETEARIAEDAKLSAITDDLADALSAETEARIAKDNELSAITDDLADALSAETEARIAEDAKLSASTSELADALSAETEARIAKDDELEGKLINVDGGVHEFSISGGTLTLQTNDGTQIEIKIKSDYGTF